MAPPTIRMIPSAANIVCPPFDVRTVRSSGPWYPPRRAQSSRVCSDARRCTDVPGTIRHPPDAPDHRRDRRSVPSRFVSDRPAYIAFEGAEGCGKSTQAKRLADSMGAVLTRETGGTEIGARIRDILHDTTVDNLAARAEALLTAADRAQHLAEVVAPGAGRRTSGGQRPVGLLLAGLPGLRPPARHRPHPPPQRLGHRRACGRRPSSSSTRPTRPSPNA